MFAEPNIRNALCHKEQGSAGYWEVRPTCSLTSPLEAVRLPWSPDANQYPQAFLAGIARIAVIRYLGHHVSISVAVVCADTDTSARIEFGVTDYFKMMRSG